MSELTPNQSLSPLEEHYVQTHTLWSDHRWFEFYLKVKTFIQRYGHDRISFYDPDWKETAHWLSSQRSIYKRGKLKPERLVLLESLPVRMDTSYRLKEQEERWEANLKELIQYQATYGHLNVPSTSTTHRSLAIWIMNQRALYKRGNLLPHRQAKLEAIGFTFVIREQITRLANGCEWSDYIQAFKQFKATYGHVIIVSDYVVDGLPLGGWVHNVRTHRLRGKLLPHREAELTKLGFAWETPPIRWQYKYEELQAFYEREGHVNVPLDHIERTYPYAGQSLNTSLGKWLEKQRQAVQKGKLSETQLNQLRQLPIDWRALGVRAYELRWYEQLRKLQQIEPVNFFIRDKSHPHYHLSIWANNQRKFYRNGELSPERIQALEAIGFVWDLREATYEQRCSITRLYSKILILIDTS